MVVMFLFFILLVVCKLVDLPLGFKWIEQKTISRKILEKKRKTFMLLDDIDKVYSLNPMSSTSVTPSSNIILEVGKWVWGRCCRELSCKKEKSFGVILQMESSTKGIGDKATSAQFNQIEKVRAVGDLEFLEIWAVLPTKIGGKGVVAPDHPTDRWNSEHMV